MDQSRGKQQQDRASADIVEKPSGMVIETSTASVALAAALADNKPGLLSKQMFRLYGIMIIGYLVSTINGFGTCARPVGHETLPARRLIECFC